MLDQEQELEAFKTRIDLAEYAVHALGFQLDRRASSRSYSVLRRGLEKIIVTVDDDGHQVYCNPHDNGDRGSIIDLVLRRKGLSFGHVRKELRPWIGRPASPLPFFPRLQHTPRDRQRVEDEYARMVDITQHGWLESERCIPPSLLGSARFVGRVRIDNRGNAVFPHFDQYGLCGFEKKNRGFTGFASGGTKGLWESHDRADDRCLVVAESAIDALSYAALFPDERARYRSVGGQVNDLQPVLIGAAVTDLPAGATVIAAMDNDESGHKLATMIEKAVSAAGRPDVGFRVHLPAQEGTDWNDALKASRPPPLPTVRL